MPDGEGVYELDLPVRTDHFEFGEGEPEMKKESLNVCTDPTTGVHFSGL